MTKRINILGFAGSLRKGSYSKAILRAAKELAPEDVELETFDLEGIPLFNQDLEKNVPEKVKIFKDKVEKADALLVVTPEHNNAVPAALKNIFEWGSRPDGDNSFDDKPAAIISISIGPRGGVNAEINLRQIFVNVNIHALNIPKLYVDFANEKIQNDELADEKTKERIRKLLIELAKWSRRLKEKNLD